MLPLLSTPLGINTSLLSVPVIIVWKICIAFTVPNCPCASIKSPTLNGFSNKMMRPPARLFKLPLIAIPMATPADASKAANEVVSTPRRAAMAIINRIVRAILTKLSRKVFTLASTLRFSSTFRVSRITSFIR